MSKVNFKLWVAATARPIWHVHLNFWESLYNWWMHKFVENSLKVEQLAKLAGLTHSLFTFFIIKPSVSKKLESFICIVKEATHEPNCAYARTCASFARVAMHHNHILWIGLEPLVSISSDLKAVMQWRGLVIGPVVFRYSISKQRFIISLSLRCIDYPILVTMLFIYKLSKLKWFVIKEYCLRLQQDYDTNFQFHLKGKKWL